MSPHRKRVWDWSKLLAMLGTIVALLTAYVDLRTKSADLKTRLHQSQAEAAELDGDNDSLKAEIAMKDLLLHRYRSEANKCRQREAAFRHQRRTPAPSGDATREAAPAADPPHSLVHFALTPLRWLWSGAKAIVGG